MYEYDEIDQTLVDDRVAQFREQVERRLAGELDEDHFKPLRLMNGLYLQLHAYMLRVAIPYGTLSSKQMRMLAHIARTYDKGYGHFSTRQNIQYNWIKLEQAADILADLASVQMHALQTSGNCIRNTTADQFAGVAADEVDDPRPYAEIIRQWSTLHPEFTFLPRKFKIAMTGAAQDRAVIKAHDIGIRVVRNDAGETGFEIWVGGGLGRTPVIGEQIAPYVPRRDLLRYLEAIMRVYNRYGRRDNIYKARIKILVRELGIDEMRRQVEAEYARMADHGLDLPEAEIERVRAFFQRQSYETLPATSGALEASAAQDPALGRFVKYNLMDHRVPGYTAVTISLKPIGGVPGDATDAQMDLVADLADTYSQGEIRVTHRQNLVLAHVKQDDIPALYAVLKENGLATPNVGLVSDIIACPGLDYCALANARSIPVAQRIAERVAENGLDVEADALSLNISGCINACGHHHVGNIGILGVDKKGTEAYQITLGGANDDNAAIGKIIGPGFSEEEVPDAVVRIIQGYLDLRQPGESFSQTYARLGDAPFKEKAYDAA